MNSGAKNKLLTWLVILLLIANAATIAMFWINKKQRPPQPKGSAKDFLIKELKLDTSQQGQLELLVKEHRQTVEALREKIKASKDSLFDLVKQPNVSDSIKQEAATEAGRVAVQIDLVTLNHFQKIRSLCTPEQQKKFDEIIHEVTSMMAPPRPPMGPNGPPGPPHEGPGDEKPPPPIPPPHN